MLTHYRLYDLTVASDEDLSLIEVDPDERQPLWRFESGAVGAPQGRLVHDVADFDGEKRLKVWVGHEGRVWFSHGDTRAVWDSEERLIRLDDGEDRHLGAGVMLERVVAPISMMIQRREHVALHASAVLGPDGGAWVFVGNSGAGKSTTALQLQRRGLPIVADDLVMIDGGSERLLVATPTVRLFDRPDRVPEAVEHRPVLAGRNKFWYRLRGTETPPSEVPIRAVVSLQPDRSGEGGDESPVLERVRGREATVRMVGQAFDLTEADADWRAQRFRTLCELARNIEVYRLVYRPDDRTDPVQVRCVAQAIGGL